MAVRTINAASALSSTSLTTVYTCPTNFTSLVKLLLVSSGSGGSKQVSVQLFDNSASSYNTLVTGLRMESSSITNILDGDQLALHSGDQLVAFAGAGATSNFTLTLSAEEFFDPLR